MAWCERIAGHVRSIPRRWLVTIALLWLASLLAEMLLMGLVSSGATCVMAVIEVLAVAVLVWDVRVGAPLVLAVWCVGYATPFTMPGVFMYMGWLAVGLLGYVSFPMAMGAVGLFLIGEYGLTFLAVPSAGVPTASNALMLAVSMSLCAAIGFVVRTMQDGRRAAMRARDQKQRMMVSSELHDVACNDLAYALTLMDQGSPHEDEVVAAVREALASVRSSLGILRENAESPESMRSSERTRTVELGKLVREGCERVASVGIKGSVVVSDGTDEVEATVPMARLLEGFMGECFGNLLKYADRTKPYTLVVGINGTAVCLSLTDVPRKGLQADRPRGSGSGLRDYGERIERLGGSLVVDDTEDRWTLDVTIPL
ncbi:MAG: hypothetical protein UHD09_02055 [Bifidobacterium sp.]|nr:hypothetical protein [Bifidobacterium sp.]